MRLFTSLDKIFDRYTWYNDPRLYTKLYYPANFCNNFSLQNISLSDFPCLNL